MDRRTTTPSYLMYDSKDLVTHAVVVGMTGSGKTGLGVGLLEEAAIDNIPAIVVDPKGDLTNLLLNFPGLTPEEFKPWVNADDARRAGKTLDEHAADQAALWKKGLAEWDQEGSRIQRLRDSAEFTIYTPGSDAGIPISILSSFAPPPAEIMNDADLFRDRVSSTATSLLAMLGINADPIRSREHILLTTILNDSWSKQINLDLGALIQMVQAPPFKKVGVMDLDSFYPAQERFELAMALNNLLASPGFSAWMNGEPLDVDRLLHTPTGKPRISICYIAHLSDAERMFFMSLLLNQTLGWMRSRPGTTSLRAVLYIDEIYGYMPPVAEPPSKKPLLTLLKQARAFGLGLVLATQNPADLDYKGLSNTGTWFLGRLQTERDKERVLDGLEGASSEA
ncbi:MAG: ATP-binding protein, partial [Planctomycetales bacterium]|nr:ATP-binding protein [Planctomycetales bacterium]